LNAVVNKAQRSQSDHDLIQKLESLKDTCPHEKDSAKDWQLWLSSLRELMLQKFNICQEVEFSAEDYENIEMYVYGNNLLMRCINESINATQSLKERLVENLLKPHHRAQCKWCE
jgi:hypothetical protein